MKIISFIFLVTNFAIDSSLAESVSKRTVFVGSSLELSCQSSFPPPWNWFGKGSKFQMLTATGLKPHPQLQNVRYSFYSDASSYFLRIEDVAFADAGKFRCETDTSISTILSVIRYNSSIYNKSIRLTLGLVTCNCVPSYP